MMLVVCLEVALRYGFNSPISWVVEISEYSLLWITFLGTAWVLRVGGHVRVDIMLQFFSPATLRVCGMISSAISGAATAIIFAFGAWATWHAYVEGTYKPTLTNVPTWMIIIVIPFGSLLLTLRFARLFAEYYSRQRDFGSEPTH
jgi:TRAP-type C4-dicarboxylate transport system permease small subunit